MQPIICGRTNKSQSQSHCVDWAFRLKVREKCALGKLAIQLGWRQFIG